MVAVHSDFGFCSTDVANYPDHIFFNRKLGGGGLLYCGVYPIASAVAIFGHTVPDCISAAGIKDDLVNTFIRTY